MTALIQSSEKDLNDDGVMDELELDLEIETLNEPIHFVQLLMVFSYQIKVNECVSDTITNTRLINRFAFVGDSRGKHGISRHSPVQLRIAIGRTASRSRSGMGTETTTQLSPIGRPLQRVCFPPVRIGRSGEKLLRQRLYILHTCKPLRAAVNNIFFRRASFLF